MIFLKLFQICITHSNGFLMDILNSIIGLLSKEEQRNFKLYALRSHSDRERKDLELFDYIRKSGDRFDERKILKRLYGGSSKKNVYYRLRNRLLSELNKSLCLLHWDKDEHAKAWHLLTLARIFHNRQNAKIAYYYLRKAESKAEQLESLELLDIVYGEMIQLSFDLGDVNPETYITKREENRHTLNRLREIDNILAVVSYRLGRSQNLGAASSEVSKLLELTLDEFSQDPALMEDSRFRFRMYHAVSNVLLQQRDYRSLERFLLDTYKSFTEEELFNRSNHDTRLQMLTYIVNTLFKNEKIDLSLEYAAKLKSAMEEFNGFLHEKYLFFYYNSLATNYSAIDIDKALEILKDMMEVPGIARVPQYQVFIHLNSALFEYFKSSHRASLKHLVQLRLSDGFAGTDQVFHFRIDIFELALRYEAGDYDVLNYRLGQFMQDYADLMEDPVLEKDRVMVGLIARMNEATDLRKDTELVAEIRDFIDRYERDDTEIFKYDDFLKARI